MDGTRRYFGMQLDEFGNRIVNVGLQALLKLLLPSDGRGVREKVTLLRVHLYVPKANRCNRWGQNAK